MQDKLLKILKIKMDAISRNIENLNYLNGELDSNNQDLEYIDKMAKSLKADDVLTFDSISKEDFEKILSMIDPSVSEIFKDKTCNYQGIMYIIQGIRQGISLELTNDQKDAILAFLAGMKNKSFALLDTIDNLKESKEHLPETDLNILTSDLKTYQEINDKLEDGKYLVEVDYLIEAFDYANILVEEKVELFEFLLKYNANIYDSLNPKNSVDETEDLSEEEAKYFNYEPLDIDFDSLKLPELDIKESSNNNLEDLEENQQAEKKDFHEYGTFEMPIISNEVLKKSSDIIEPDMKNLNAANPMAENTSTIKNDEDFLNDFSKSSQEELKEEENINTVDLEDIIQRIDNKLKEIEVPDDASDNNNFVPINEIDLNTPNIDYSNDSTKDKVAKPDYHELLTKYDLDIKLDDSLDYYEIEAILKTLEENKLLTILKEKPSILTRILNKNTNSSLTKVLDLIKENLVDSTDTFEAVIEIVIQTMPILLSDSTVIDSFAKNIEFFHENKINLINLFDNYRELLIMNNESLISNNMKILKYGLALNNDNVRYLLYNKNILTNLDAFIEAVGYEKGFLGKEDMFDGVEYIKKYPYKLNTASPDLLLKLRFQSEHNQKIYGSKPGILAGEISNPKVDILQIPEEYKKLYFNHEYSSVDTNEINDLLKSIANQDVIDTNLDDVLLQLDQKYKESELRYKINNILISRIKTIRVYNFLKEKGYPTKTSLLIALTYNSVIKNEEYKVLDDVVNAIEGGK